MFRNDYVAIGVKYGLEGLALARYSEYMSTRWPQGVTKEYAEEWAERFGQGREYEASDGTGRGILKQIDK